ncbi:hypothetical protein KJ975_03100 [Myxococcota bacterium]|nr:hypothetical protein [Myxococcota bacterium]
MKIAPVSLFLLLAFLSGPALSKQCPSRLPEKMHQVGEKELYWGLEFRMAHFFSWDKDLSAPVPETTFSHNGFGALRGAVEYAPAPWLNFRLETELKVRNGVENCNAWTVGLPKKFEMIPQLRNLYAQIEPWEEAELRIGRQNIAWGTQALVDNFFDAVSLRQPLGEKLSIEVFGGVFAPELTREALGCGYEMYYENRKAWKRLCSIDYGDVIMAGASLRIKNFKPHQIWLSHITQWDRRDVDEPTVAQPEPLTTMFGSLYVSGPISGELGYELEALAGYKPGNSALIPGYVAGLEYTLDLPRGHLSFLPKVAGAFSDDEGNHFTSLGEGFDLGSRARYGLYDGHVKSMTLRYKWWAYRFDVAYHWHSVKFADDDLDDELEAGVTMFWNNDSRYQFLAVYSLMNVFAGDLAPSHGFRLVARIIF